MDCFAAEHFGGEIILGDDLTRVSSGLTCLECLKLLSFYGLARKRSLEPAGCVLQTSGGFVKGWKESERVLR